MNAGAQKGGPYIGFLLRNLQFTPVYPRVLQHTKSTKRQMVSVHLFTGLGSVLSQSVEWPLSQLEPQSEDVSTIVENFNNILRLSL